MLIRVVEPETFREWLKLFRKRKKETVVFTTPYPLITGLPRELVEQRIEKARQDLIQQLKDFLDKLEKKYRDHVLVMTTPVFEYDGLEVVNWTNYFLVKKPEFLRKLRHRYEEVTAGADAPLRQDDSGSGADGGGE